MSSPDEIVSETSSEGTKTEVTKQLYSPKDYFKVVNHDKSQLFCSVFLLYIHHLLMAGL